MNFTFFPMLAVSSSGTLCYTPASSEDLDLVLVDRDGNEQLLLRDRVFWVPRFSPDGTRIAFGIIMPDDGQEDIWIYDLAAGTTSRLTLDGEGNNDPVWNPDGTSIAFSSSAGAHKDLYVLSAEGGDPDLVVAQDGAQWTSDWSPDGRHLVFTNFIRRTVGGWPIIQTSPVSSKYTYRPSLSPETRG